MAKYVATRIIEALNKKDIKVQGQSKYTLNWETIKTYGKDDIEYAIKYACDTACELSYENKELVTAYDFGGYEIRSYLNGDQY